MASITGSFFSDFISNSVVQDVQNTIAAPAKSLFSGAFKPNNKTTIKNSADYIQFPNDLLNRSDIQQYTKLVCKDNEISWNGTTTKRTYLGAIYLPLPAELNVEYRSDWSSEAAGWSGTTGMQSAMKDAVGSASTGSATFNGFQKAAASAIQDAANYKVAAAIQEKAAEAGMGAVVQKALQKVVNPMKLLLWNSPDFRTFSFSFDLVPVNGSEAEDLNQIIYWLKRYIHTPSAPDAITLDYPPLWDIEFVDSQNFSSQSKPNKFLFKTSECAITNINVDYTAKGKVFHRVGEDNNGYHAPNGVKISISFMETKILTQKDFGDTYSNEATP